MSEFSWHRTIEDVDFEGVPVPGLRGEFYRRPAGTGTESVGVYSYAGDEVFLAWGFVGEAHCRYAALRLADGTWDTRRGCPRIRVLLDDGVVTGLALRTRDGERVLRRELQASLRA
ncbi:hypothetical protein [Longispora albida]|uniref:hypothetical protein n=1 Tax=Longispora albida TaxID=203523 RepID=UPI0003792F86|nr:hypothetical protein [Longispora albida]